MDTIGPLQLTKTIFLMLGSMDLVKLEKISKEEEKAQMLIPSQVSRENKDNDTKMSCTDPPDDGNNNNNSGTANALKSQTESSEATQAAYDKADTLDSNNVHPSDERNKTEFHGVESRLLPVFRQALSFCKQPCRTHLVN